LYQGESCYFPPCHPNCRSRLSAVHHLFTNRSTTTYPIVALGHLVDSIDNINNIRTQGSQTRIEDECAMGPDVVPTDSGDWPLSPPWLRFEVCIAILVVFAHITYHSSCLDAYYVLHLLTIGNNIVYCTIILAVQNVVDLTLEVRTDRICEIQRSQ
jgi:hypothetical protein